MHDDPTATSTEQQLLERVARLQQQVDQLEARVAQLEHGGGSARRASSSAGGSAPLIASSVEWVLPYEVAQLDVGDTWIELHEPSARRKLHELIVEVVRVEGPVTEQVALKRVREAWGLKRAGARVQQVFEQATRQLAFQEQIERGNDDVLRMPGHELQQVRVPSADDATRRAVDEIPNVELELALSRAAADSGSIEASDLTMIVAKLFGWTRRGAEIQGRLDARVDALVRAGTLERVGTLVRSAAP